MILLPNLPLLKMLLLSQVVNGVLLPFVLIFMLLLINKNDPDGQVRELQVLQLGGMGHWQA